MANGHKYTEEQDAFIRHNYTNVSDCVRKFNKRFGTKLSYSAIKSHARRLGLTTGFRPWTDEMNAAIASILLDNPYKQATEEFNLQFGTDFTVKQIQDHCVRSGIKRNHAAFLEQVDEIISKNIGKTYEEIRKIIHERTGKEYRDYTAVCVRATNLGLSRPHRVWQTSDRRIINGEEVTFSEYVRFIGNRWHRLAPELQPLALQVIRLQVVLRDKETERGTCDEHLRINPGHLAVPECGFRGGGRVGRHLQGKRASGRARVDHIRRAGPLGGDAQAADLRFDSGGRVPKKEGE